MRVSGFWSAVGLVIGGLIIADLVLHAHGTATAFQGITGLTSSTGNQLIGTPAKG
jgi:uncharacterized sodium:solute symporter family permease YidK